MAGPSHSISRCPHGSKHLLTRLDLLGMFSCCTALTSELMQKPRSSIGSAGHSSTAKGTASAKLQDTFEMFRCTTGGGHSAQPFPYGGELRLHPDLCLQSSARAADRKQSKNSWPLRRYPLEVQALKRPQSLSVARVMANPPFPRQQNKHGRGKS